jgi:PIN domain nuclease of toxin-antitoxin system
VTAWEISIKYGIGKLQLPKKPELFIQDRVGRAEFSYLNIDLPHVMRVHSLPDIHRDPFDRLLISQAKIEEMTVLSDDPIFERYKIDTLGLRSIS